MAEVLVQGSEKFTDQQCILVAQSIDGVSATPVTETTTSVTVDNAKTEDAKRYCDICLVRGAGRCPGF